MYALLVARPRFDEVLLVVGTSLAHTTARSRNWYRLPLNRPKLHTFMEKPMEPIVKLQTPFKASWFAFACVLAVSVGTVGQEESAPTNEFTVLATTEDRDEYRALQREAAVELLEPSSLSQEHKELLANALSKVYMGIPVGSYTRTVRVEDSTEEESEEHSSTWMVNESGVVHRDGEQVDYTLARAISNSPFQGSMAFAIDAEKIRLARETDTEATFVWEIDMSEGAKAMEETADSLDSEVAEDAPMSEADAMRAVGGLFGKGKFVGEITVDRSDESVKHYVMLRLENTVRRRLLFKITSMVMDHHFSFIEDCDGYAVRRSNFDMAGSALVVGNFTSTETTTFTDITCEQPLRYLEIPE